MTKFTLALFAVPFIAMAIAFSPFSIPANTQAQTTGGLWGHYGTPRGDSFVHKDSVIETINFPNLGSVFVARAGRADDVRVTWMGYVRVDTASTYTFRIDVASASQRSRFEIDGSTKWDTTGDKAASVTLSAGWHSISVMTLTAPGETNAQAQFYWKRTGLSEQIIPAGNLSPEEGLVQVVTVPGLPKPKEKFNYRVTGIKLNEFPLAFGDGADYITFSAWVKTSAANGYIVHGDRGSASDPDEVALRVAGGYPEFVMIRGGGACTSVAKSSVRVDQDGKWHHIVGLRESRRGAARIYVDGALRGSVGNSSCANAYASMDSPDRIEIGSKEGSSGFFNGVIDDVRIYNRALTNEEIKTGAWFTGNSPPSQGIIPQIGLIGHWAMSESSGNTTADATRHNNTGTLRNSPSRVTGAFGRGISFNGSNQYIDIYDTGISDNVIELNLGSIVPSGESVMDDEVLIFWSEKDINDPSPGVRVRNCSTCSWTSVSGNPVRNLAGTVEGAWAKLPSSLIPASGTLRLEFRDDDATPGLQNGLALLLPYTDGSLPQVGRVSLYLAAGHAYSGISPVAVIPVEGVTTLEPFFVFFDGQTGFTAPDRYRTNYVRLLTGTDIATAPDRFSVLSKIGGGILYPAASGKPCPFVKAPECPSKNPSAWYPLFGRNGKNFDILSSRYAVSAWTGEVNLGSSSVSPIPLPAGTEWVAFQMASSNFAADGLNDLPESVGFFAGVGAFSTLELDEEPGSFGFSLSPTPSTIAVESGEAVQTSIAVSHVSGTPAPVTFAGGDVSGLPTGATPSFSPGNCTPPDGGSCQVQLTITTTASTPSGSYPLTILGRSGGASETTNITLNVSLPPAFEFSINPTPPGISVESGNAGQTTILVAHENGTPASVTFAESDVTGLPVGATPTFSPGNCTPPSGSSCSVSLTIATTALTPAGSYPITIRGRSGGTTETANVTLNVTLPAPPTVSISASPERVTEGGSSTITWSASGADSCTVTGPGGLIAGGMCASTPRACNSGGSPHNTGPLTTDSEYRITCLSTGGTSEGAVNVSVKVVVIKEI